MDTPAPTTPILTLDPEELGRKVREIWIEWAIQQPNPKPSWLVPWERLSEPDKEVDRRIGMRIAVGIVARLRNNLDNQKELFERHTKAVSEFLNELYSIAVDPLADGAKEVSEVRKELMAAVIRDRDLRSRLDGANALLAKCFDYVGEDIKRMSLRESATGGTQGLHLEIAQYLDTTNLKPSN